MPEQGWAVGWFADDASVAKLGVVEPELLQRCEHVGVGDEFGHYRILIGHGPIDHHHAAGRAMLLKMRWVLSGEHVIGAAP